ncbi:MAG: vWA domain-containing protein [Shimia sp.]
MINLKSIISGICAAVSFGGGAFAQAPDMMVVFDGSGSMWGQIDGRAKIEIARDTLSSVLSEVPGDAEMGMIAYGHRQKGQCTDIETMVPVAPAGRAVPAMIAAAARINPKGKTPLSDAVRLAARELRYTENAATVILVTDGIETCNADPCALASELERAGVGFTAHVVGFGLSAEEGRQVACLAENTGGLYLSAGNATELGAALAQAVAPIDIGLDAEDFEPIAPAPRNVRFILRDTAGGEQLGTRQLTGTLRRDDGEPLPTEALVFAYPEASGNSATASLAPGEYTLALVRTHGGKTRYTTDVRFTVPSGQGEYVVEQTLAGQLTIRPFLNPETPYDISNRPPSAVKGRAVAWFSIYPVEEGIIAESPVAGPVVDRLSFPLGNGTYVIRGNLARTVTAEQLVEVSGDTEVDFSFDVTRVYLDLRNDDGTPVQRVSTYWHDDITNIRAGRNHWVRGGGVREGQLLPFYLPTGSYYVNTGREGKWRSELIVDIPGDFRDVRLRVTPGMSPSESAVARYQSPARQGCAKIAKVKYNGCVVKTAVTTAPPLDGLPPTAREPAVVGVTLRHVFVDATLAPRMEVITDPGLTDATIVLLEGWCGWPACGQGEFSVPRAELELLDADGFGSTTVPLGIVDLRFEHQGDTQAARLVATSGAVIDLSRMDTLVEPGRGTTSGGVGPQTVAASMSPFFGVFNFQPGDDPVAMARSFDHVVTCQRTQMVFYPDGTVTVKEFRPPSSPTKNPFQAVASGSCRAEGAQTTCDVAGVDGSQPESLTFAATPVADGHFTLDVAGEEMMAVSCFTPDGAAQASAVMPNGRQLGELVLERRDGAAPGMSFDAQNRLVLE